jgi:hypothetical protein
MAISSQSIREHESVASVVFGAAQSKAVTESVDLFGVDGEDSDTTHQKCVNDRTMRFFDGDADAFWVLLCQVNEPIDGGCKPFDAMSEALFGNKLSVSIDDRRDMKPASQIDTDEQRRLPP